MVLMIFGMHLLGAVCVAILLIPALRDGPAPPPPTDQGSDDDGGRGPRRPPKPPERPPRGGIPLPDAQPARVRLRDHDRLFDRLPKRERRPVREPDRKPVRLGPAIGRPSDPSDSSVRALRQPAVAKRHPGDRWARLPADHNPADWYWHQT